MDCLFGPIYGDLKIRIRIMDNHFSDQAMEMQATDLRDICGKYKRDKRMWAAVLDNLEKKVKVNTWFPRLDLLT